MCWWYESNRDDRIIQDVCVVIYLVQQFSLFLLVLVFRVGVGVRWGRSGDGFDVGSGDGWAIDFDGFKNHVGPLLLHGLRWMHPIHQPTEMYPMFLFPPTRVFLWWCLRVLVCMSHVSCWFQWCWCWWSGEIWSYFVAWMGIVWSVRAWRFCVVTVWCNSMCVDWMVGWCRG